MQGTPAILLDRDGTLIFDRHYLSEPDQVELLPGAAAALRRLQAAGLKLVVVSNQSGLGRGLFDLAALNRVHRRLEELLADQQVRLDGIYFCPHRAEVGCGCRKPEPGLAQAAAKDLGLDLSSSFVVGDKPCDVQLGERIGATSILVRTGHGAQHAERGDCDPDFVCDDLAAASVHVLRLAPMKWDRAGLRRAG